MNVKQTLVLDLPDIDRKLWTDTLEDFEELGWLAKPIDIVDMGLFAIGRIGYRVERLPEIAGLYQQIMSDHFDQRVGPDLLNELILSCMEDVYLEMLKTFSSLGIVDRPFRVIGISDQFILLEM